MAQTFPLKNIPAPVRSLIRPMLYASIGLHALLLFVPLSSTEEKPKEQQETVKVTQLAPLQQPSRQKVKPTPRTKPSPSSTRTLVRRAPTRTTIPATRATNKPEPPQSTTPETAQDTSSEPDSLPTTDLFADFPRYPGATKGSFGKLRGGFNEASFQTGDDLTKVEAFFLSELPKKKYLYSPETVERSDSKIYQVSKEGSSPQFLHLFKISEQGTVILLAPNILNFKDLANTIAEVVPPQQREIEEVVDFLAQDTIAFASILDSNELAQPDAVQAGDTRIAFEVGKAVKINSTPIPLPELEANFQDNLTGKDFTVTAAGDYGGGPLYEVSKGSFTQYLNFIPTQDGAYAVYIWKSKPNS